MQKRHRMLLLAILVVAVSASISWMLPVCAYQGSAYAPALDSVPVARVTSSDSAPRPELLRSPSSRLDHQPSYAVRLDDGSAPSTGRAAPDISLCYILDGQSSLFARPANTHRPVKHLPSVGVVSTATAFHQHVGKQLHCLATGSTPTQTSVLESPLNRGPTHHAC